MVMIAQIWAKSIYKVAKSEKNLGVGTMIMIMLMMMMMMTGPPLDDEWYFTHFIAVWQRFGFSLAVLDDQFSSRKFRHDHGWGNCRKTIASRIFLKI